MYLFSILKQKNKIFRIRMMLIIIFMIFLFGIFINLIVFLHQIKIKMKRINPFLKFLFNLALIDILLLLISQQLINNEEIITASHTIDYLKHKVLIDFIFKIQIFVRYSLIHMVTLILMGVSSDRAINICKNIFSKKFNNHSIRIQNQSIRNQIVFKKVIQLLLYMILFVACINLHIYYLLSFIKNLNIL